jgi:hypothetical protein
MQAIEAGRPGWLATSSASTFALVGWWHPTGSCWQVVQQ